MSDLDAMLKRAAQHKMTPAERHAQRRSWVIGQMMLSHPEITREEAERLADGAVGPNLAARVAELEAENVSLREDAARFQALMRCGRIKPQGSCGVDPITGERRYPETPGAVHFGAEFWVQPEPEPSQFTTWGRHCLRALADDILAYEAARPTAPATEQEEP